ncbi:MAG: hypothetical protein H7Z14_02805, partial [Anaerolineae bacterium]|nr:hypothetical protein [Phycisphaerae bacterium]
GTIVGSAVIGADVDRATLWRTDGTIVNLDSWLDSAFPTMGAKWELWTAADINNAGLVVGRGFYNDGPAGLPDGVRGFVLNASALNSPVPAPSAIAMIAGTISATLWRRRR